MKTAIILNGSLNSIIRQAEELNSYITRFFSIDDEIEAWILTDEDVDLKNIAIPYHIKKIKLIIFKTKYVVEEFLEAIIFVYELSKPQMMIFGSEDFVSGLAVRTAYRLKGTCYVGIKRSKYYEGKVIVEKTVYSNNLTAEFIMKKMPFCISISKGFRDKIERPKLLPKVERIFLKPLINTEWLQSYKLEIIDAVDDLNTAKIVIAVGKGVGSKDKMGLIEEVTMLLGGKLGASRPVVMNAWTKMNNLIGASGSIISPEICITIGVSGSAAFTVGIEKSKFIISINNDQKAPIFKISDVAICSEYQEIIYELIRKLK